MGLNPVKITNNNTLEIQNQIRQKSQEANNSDSLRTAKIAHDIIEEELSPENANDLYFYGDTSGFKTYRFNGKLNQGEDHLGSNFDMVV